LHTHEHFFGFKVIENGHFSKVTLVAPHSPAWKAGLFNGDEILAVNNMMLKNNFNQWLHYFIEQPEIILTVNSGEQLKSIRLQKDKKGNTYFYNPMLQLQHKTTEAFNVWRKF
jgi:predicted metalloprotease with PDZ domain